MKKWDTGWDREEFYQWMPARRSDYTCSRSQ